MRTLFWIITHLSPREFLKAEARVWRRWLDFAVLAWKWRCLFYVNLMKRVDDRDKQGMVNS